MLMFENEPREDTVTISIDEYTDLIKAAENWKNIRYAIWDETKVIVDSVTQDPELQLTGYRVLEMMKVIDRTMYKEVLDGRFNHI